MNAKKQTLSQHPAVSNLSLDTWLLIFFLLLKVVLSYVLVNDIYELHRDEFLHLDQANHLSAGFTSVPPLTSLFSLVIKTLGNSYCIIKFFPAAFGGLTILYCWRIVEHLGGNLLAKILVAIALLFSVYLRLNTLYQPNSFDVLSWTASFYYLIRYFDKVEPKYLYYFAVAVALGFLNKYNILFLLMGLLPALTLNSTRSIFANKHLYTSILIGLVIVLPNIVWQVAHDFPVITHMKLLEKTQLIHVNRADFFISQILFFACSIITLFAGFGALIFYKGFDKYRWVMVTYIFTILIFSYFKAKDYYALGLYPVLLAFGARYLGIILSRRYVLACLLIIFNIGLFVYVLPLVMPIYSPQQIIAHHKRFEQIGMLRWEDGKNHQLPQDYADMQGWREIASLTDLAYGKIKDKSTLLIRADNYGLAGAVNYYSKYPKIGAVSYNADYLYWFKLDRAVKNLILIREAGEEDPERKKERPFFEKITKIGAITNPYSREFGASVFLLEGAKINVNQRIQAEIEEEKNDN